MSFCLFSNHCTAPQIPARFVTLIPREFPASQSGRGGGTKGTNASVGTSGTKRKSSTASSSGTSTKKKTAVADSGGAGGDAFFDDISSLDFGADPLGGFDDLDLDFDKPLDEQAAGEEFSPF